MRLPAAFGLLIIGALAAAPGKQKFTGVITDSMCATADHSQMRMGPTDAECAVACVEAHGATYVLYDGKRAYALSDQKAPEKFAGKKSDGCRRVGRQNPDDPGGLDGFSKITPAK